MKIVVPAAILLLGPPLLIWSHLRPSKHPRSIRHIKKYQDV